MYDLYLFLDDRRVDVGKVKIIERGLDGGRPNIPDEFERLGPAFISLGQDHDYYEALTRAGSDIGREVLAALNDVVLLPDLEADFANERAYTDSLLRFSGAVSARETARVLLSDAEVPPSEPVALRVRTSVGGEDFEIDFEWSPDAAVPGHVAAVIGYNGTGKTQLLANLAFLVADTGIDLSSTEHAGRGRVVSNSLGTFASVVSVSFSAFDTFAIPSAQNPLLVQHLESTGSAFGYAYIGLRKQSTLAGQPRSFVLKDQDELARDFRDSLERALRKDRFGLLRQALEELMGEPSFVTTGLTPEVLASVQSAMVVFDSLSTGHKLVLNVVVSLAALLQPRSLLLLDEPESHLHPPLVAAMLAAIRQILRHQGSLAIVATHSPVVVQEVPARHVRVLRRYGNSTVASGIDLETFGENVGFLTRTIFSLDSAATDYQNVLRTLAASLSPEEVESLFPLGPSQQARSILATYRATPDDDVSG
jgi:predicted ATPase